jgi:hypothetical protein
MESREIHFHFRTADKFSRLVSFLPRIDPVMDAQPDSGSARRFSFVREDFLGVSPENARCKIGRHRFSFQRLRQSINRSEVGCQKLKTNRN